MSTITVSTSFDYSALAVIDVANITFTNTAPRDLVTATFAATQFDNIHIFDSVTITGSAGRNGLSVHGSSIAGATWNFVNWSTGDAVTLNGTAGADLLGGTTQGDRINGFLGDDEIAGGLGLDKVYAGGGNDSIRYTSDSELVNGEIFDGGSGADLLVLEGASGTSYDFRQCIVAGVEQLQFEGGGSASFAASQFGAAAITTVIGNLIADSLTIAGQVIDLSGVSFTDWTDGSDAIWLQGHSVLASTITGSSHADNISGSMAGDTLSGQGGNDFITGGLGADIMTGGEGDDVFGLYKLLDVAGGEVMDGGNGTDTLSIMSGSGYELWRLSLVSVERLSFSLLGGDAAIAGTQIGAGAGLIHTVASSLSANTLTVLGPAVNLAGVSFSGWSLFDSVHIQGQSDAVNALTGSSQADAITGGALDDVIVGGKGADIITGGLGKDVMTGGNQGDYYVYTGIAESTVGAARDKITDFSLGNDIIDLSAIDAIEGGGDDAFVFKGNAAFDGAGQVRYFVNASGNTVVEADVDGGGADFQILLIGNIALTEDEFIL